MAKLYTVLKASTKQIRKIITKDLKAAGYEPDIHDDFIYAKGDIPVLLIAHYDTVHKAPPKYIRNIDGILSSDNGLGADDRAGVYGVLEIIKTHKCHVLFTDGEESGCIGASAFESSGIMPEVNYCIELDRRGSNDAVYYDGDNDEFEQYITKHGWKTDWGSFTDICVVAPYLGVSAVNLSIGYQNEHTLKETLDTKVMNANIERVKELFDGKKFEWVEAPYQYGYGSYGYYGRYGWDDYDSDWWKRYSSEYKRTPAKITVPCWHILGETLQGVEFDGWVYADTYTEAVGDFLMEHPTLSYQEIVDVYIDDDYSEPENNITPLDTKVAVN